MRTVGRQHARKFIAAARLTPAERDVVMRFLDDMAKEISLEMATDVGKSKLRALIEDRDRGCRLCGAHGFLHVHHIVHWTKGGPTVTGNLIAVCTSCHRAIHRDEVRVSGNPDDPDGLLILDGDGRPPPRPGPRPTSYLPEAPQAYGGPDRRRWTSQRFGYWVPSRRWN